MVEKHPYISGAGAIAAAITQFRKSFPVKVNADTLKKLGIAPNNESYLINILRFLDLIDDEGNKTAKATSTFTKHEDAEFQKAFEGVVKSAYKDLFDLHSDAAWTLEESRLISFFRNTDETSDLVGKRQTGTFQALASFAGTGKHQFQELQRLEPRTFGQSLQRPHLLQGFKRSMRMEARAQAANIATATSG